MSVPSLAQGYDAFDVDEDGVLSLDDFLSALDELQLAFSREASVALFESLASSAAPGGAQRIPRDAWVSVMGEAIARVSRVQHEEEAQRAGGAAGEAGATDAAAAERGQGDAGPSAAPAQAGVDGDAVHAGGGDAAGGGGAADAAQSITPSPDLERQSETQGEGGGGRGRRRQLPPSLAQRVKERGGQEMPA